MEKQKVLLELENAGYEILESIVNVLNNSKVNKKNKTFIMNQINSIFTIGFFIGKSNEELLDWIQKYSKI